MVHPSQRIAAKRRVAGKLASKKEIAATNLFYGLDDLGDPEDEVIIEENRAIVRRTFFYETGLCKKHDKFFCKSCLDMLNG